jgi:hypothetical protein
MFILLNHNSFIPRSTRRIGDAGRRDSGGRGAEVGQALSAVQVFSKNRAIRK